MMQALFRLLDPEDAHVLASYALRALGVPPLYKLGQALEVRDPILEQNVFGIRFTNAIGLAGGFDKQGTLVRGLETLGFGFVEVGTVTRHAQPGNPRPRIFKDEKSQAILNRMGFNNNGAAALRTTLQNTVHRQPLGISLGKSKVTELVDAAEDYRYSFETLYAYGDYFVINVSSPNTPGLRSLQDKSALLNIVSALTEFRSTESVRKPILIKVSPDLSESAYLEVIDVVAEKKLDGIIATNTLATAEGGQSGRPLKERSTDVIRFLHTHAPRIPLIGVGGVFSAQDAYDKIRAGASLIQLYSGFIYGGPLIAGCIRSELVALLRRDGYSSITEVVGAGIVRG